MDLPSRKRIRLKGYDYSSPGAYFITICTKDKKCILGKIVGTDLPGGPYNELSVYGVVAEKYIENMKDFYDYIKIEKYIVMPNHIHMILRVTEMAGQKRTVGTPVPTNSVVAGFVGTFKRFCNKEYGVNIWQISFHDHIIRGEKDYAKIWQYIDTNVLKWEQDCFYIK